MKSKFVLVLISLLVLFAIAADAPEPVDWTQVLSDVISAVLVIVIPPVVASVIGVLTAYKRRIEQKIGAENMYIADVIFENGVRASEQAGLTGKITEKFEYALDYIENRLAGVGIDMDLDEIVDDIEAKVNLLYPKEPQPPHVGLIPEDTDG